jgi:hypothetical protein
MKRKGIKINRRIVVLESDDWGSIRVPSIAAIEKLRSEGVALCAPTRYDRFDTLETEADLTSLMEVLNSVRDKNGNPARMTMNFVMANPDFEKIGKEGYRGYYYEHFTETYQHYPHSHDSFNYIRQGMEEAVFRPQFHGREHLNVPKWMHEIEKGNEAVIKAFVEGCFSLRIDEFGKKTHFLEAWNVENEEEMKYLGEVVKEGLEMFEKTFGYVSRSMIAPCYTWDPEIEQIAFDKNVRILQSSIVQRHSKFYHSLTGKHSSTRYLGERNETGQIYTIRNCYFEPSDNPRNNADRCLKNIEQQFSWHHPAIISCHRQNFIGELVPENRDKNLREFKQMLKAIVRKYPDVEFLSSDELGSYLSSL